MLERIDTRVLDKTTLPDWPNPDRNVWPPPSNFAAAYVQSMGVPRHPGAAWSDPGFQERRRAELVAEDERMALHAQKAAKEQEEGQNRELREQFQARHH